MSLVGASPANAAPIRVSAATPAATKYKQMSLTYSQKLDFMFMPGPTVTLTRTKRVYLGV